MARAKHIKTYTPTGPNGIYPGGRQAVMEKRAPVFEWVRESEVVDVWEYKDKLIALNDAAGDSLDAEEYAVWNVAVQTPGGDWLDLDDIPDELWAGGKEEALKHAKKAIDNMSGSRVPDWSWPRWGDDNLREQLREFRASKPTQWEYIQILRENDPNGSYEYLITEPIEDAEEVFDEVFGEFLEEED